MMANGMGYVECIAMSRRDCADQDDARPKDVQNILDKVVFDFFVPEAGGINRLIGVECGIGIISDATIADATTILSRWQITQRGQTSL